MQFFDLAPQGGAAHSELASRGNFAALVPCKNLSDRSGFGGFQRIGGKWCADRSCSFSQEFLRQIPLFDEWSFTEHLGVLQNVFQLPHVSRELVVEQQFHGLLGDPGKSFALD